MSPKFLILALKDFECDPILLILILFHLSFEIIIYLYTYVSEAYFLLSGSRDKKIDLSKLLSYYNYITLHSWLSQNHVDFDYIHPTKHHHDLQGLNPPTIFTVGGAHIYILCAVQSNSPRTFY
jgi:succinate dehydrogenase hydrophobic anchor subunit